MSMFAIFEDALQIGLQVLYAIDDGRSVVKMASRLRVDYRGKKVMRHFTLSSFRRRHPEVDTLVYASAYDAQMHEFAEEARLRVVHLWVSATGETESRRTTIYNKCLRK